MGKANFSPYWEKPSIVSAVDGVVTCLQPWRSFLVAGREDGKIIVLSGKLDPGDPSRSFLWRLLSSPYRAGKTVKQLMAFEDRELLFALTNEGVNMYSLPQLKLKGQAPRTAGALCFSWDSSRNLLAVASKRRVLIFKYNLDLLLDREISHSMASPPKCLCICGDSIFLQSLRETTVVSMPHGSVTKLHDAPIKETKSTRRTTASTSSDATGSDLYVSMNLSEVGLLITSDCMTRCYDHRGIEVGKPLIWKETPKQIVVLNHYHQTIAALFPSGALSLQSVLNFSADKDHDVQRILEQSIQADSAKIDLVATAPWRHRASSSSSSSTCDAPPASKSPPAPPPSLPKGSDPRITAAGLEDLSSAMFVIDVSETSEVEKKEQHKILMFRPAPARIVAAQLVAAKEYAAALTVCRRYRAKHCGLDDDDEEEEEEDGVEDVDASESTSPAEGMSLHGSKEKRKSSPSMVDGSSHHLVHSSSSAEYPLNTMDAKELQDIETQAHLGLGRELLHEGHYDEAMHHLSLGDLYNPLPLLMYFPQGYLVPEGMLQRVTLGVRRFALPPKEERTLIQNPADAVVAMIPYLLACRARRASRLGDSMPVKRGSSSSEQTVSPLSLASGRDGPSGRATKELGAEGSGDDEDARMQRENVSATKSFGSSSVASFAQAYRDGERDPTIGPVSVLLDTALALALLTTEEDRGDLLQLLHRPNSVDVAVASEMFQKQGRFSELIALYENHSHPDKALDVLRSLAVDRESLPSVPKGAAVDLHGQPAAWAAIRILSTLDPPDTRLIREHYEWILSVDIEAGVGLFVHLFPRLPPSSAIPILTTHGGPELSCLYLERVLQEGGGHEQELATLYLQRLLALRSQSEGSLKAFVATGSADTAPEKNNGDAQFIEKDILIQKLRDLILKAVQLDSAALRGLLPSQGLWEIRAALYEREGKHIDALRCFIHRLHSVEEAEAYCLRVTNQQRRAAMAAEDARGSRRRPTDVPMSLSKVYPAEIWNTLLDILMEEEESRPGMYRRRPWAAHDERWTQIAEILGRRHRYIDPLQAAKRFPNQVSLVSISKFLEAALQGSVETRRAAVLKKSVLRSRSISAANEIGTLEKDYVIVAADRACFRCHKRIGNTAFVRLPSSMLLHFSCYQQQRDHSRNRRASPSGQWANAA